MPNSTACARPHNQPSATHPAAAHVISQPMVYVVRGRPGPLDRPALPSGHPESWGAITQGTVLDQSTYPFPIFLDLPQ